MEIEHTDKIYAVLIAKRPGGTGTVQFVKAPESISDAVHSLAKQYPDSKIRVFEHGWQADYFGGIPERMW